jgi:hypothetical protein
VENNRGFMFILQIASKASRFRISGLSAAAIYASAPRFVENLKMKINSRTLLKG